MAELANDGAADLCQLWLGDEQQGVDAADGAVDIGLLTLIFEVFHGAHALDEELCLHLACQVDGQAVEGAHLDGWHVGIEAADGFHAFGGGCERRFVHVVADHADDHLVEEWQRTPHDVVVPDGEGVEAAGEESCSH